MNWILPKWRHLWQRNLCTHAQINTRFFSFSLFIPNDFNTVWSPDLFLYALYVFPYFLFHSHVLCLSFSLSFPICINTPLSYRKRNFKYYDSLDSFSSEINLWISSISFECYHFINKFYPYYFNSEYLNFWL